MGWKPKTWKLNFRGSKEQWMVILAIGLICLILAFPAGGTGKRAGSGAAAEGRISGQGSAGGSSAGGEGSNGGSGGTGMDQGDKTGDGGARNQDSSQAASKGVLTYEQQLEARLKELLSHVEGVGEVEVMIVLKSSEERIWRTDRNSSSSSTQETDSNGGTRDVRNQELSETTILSGQNGTQEPLLEKELKPEVSGVVVTATGGGSPSVQAEISAAVEALFDVPSHKIKVLKRAE